LLQCLEKFQGWCCPENDPGKGGAKKKKMGRRGRGSSSEGGRGSRVNPSDTHVWGVYLAWIEVGITNEKQTAFFHREEKGEKKGEVCERSLAVGFLLPKLLFSAG